MDFDLPDLDLNEDINLLVPDDHPLPHIIRNRAHRAVNNLDKSLDIQNYDPLPPPDELKEFSTYLIPPKGRNLGEQISYTNVRPAGPQRGPEMIIRDPGGYVKEPYKEAKSEIESFNIFIDDEIVSKLVHYTNLKMKKFEESLLPQTREHIRSSSTYSYFYPVDTLDIRGYLGLKILRGMLSQNGWDTSRLWTDQVGHPVFAATMSRARFQFLQRMVSFDLEEDRESRRLYDKGCVVREILEDFNDNCSKVIIPSPWLCIDECLYPSRNRLSFRQYIPSKPAKYGLLFKNINDCLFPYTYRSEFFCGKPKCGPSLYYLNTTTGIVLRLVDSLAKHSGGLSGRNLTTDNLYGSIELAKMLLERNMTTVSTMRHNRRGIPKEIKPVVNREENSTETFYETVSKKISLSSYVVKNSKKMKNIIMLSTMDPLLGVTKDDGKKKPAIFKVYDYTKGICHS